jgi:hypothetical protein
MKLALTIIISLIAVLAVLDLFDADTAKATAVPRAWIDGSRP